MDTSIIVALILGASSIITSIIFGWIPRVRQAKLLAQKKELLTLYEDIDKFIKIEEKLTKQLNISKIKARDGIKISEKSEPARVKRRINELKKEIE